MSNDSHTNVLIDEKNCNRNSNFPDKISTKVQLDILVRLLIRTQSILCAIISDGQDGETSFKMKHEIVIEALLIVKIKLEEVEQLTYQLSKQIKD
ncbi:MAG: hypothetical protein V4525_01410 [Pseudomonadota bacterium]